LLTLKKDKYEFIGQLYHSVLNVNTNAMSEITLNQIILALLFASFKLFSTRKNVFNQVRISKYTERIEKKIID